MFIRFVVGHDREHHRSLTGIVTEARLLRDQGVLDKYQIQRLEDLYEWLNSNLPCPPFSSSGWSRDAVTWFKDDAGESIRKLWEITAILKDHGVPVRLLRSANPGKILFEDPFQVVVEEWKQLRASFRPRLGSAKQALEAAGARRLRNEFFLSAPQLKRDSLSSRVRHA